MNRWRTLDQPELHVRPLEDVLLIASMTAASRAASMRVRGGVKPIVADAGEIIPEREGRAFRIPLVIPEDLESGDGRTFDKGALTLRDMPIPLLWQIQTGDGHNGSVLVGRIDSCGRVENGLGNAYGKFDSGPYGQEAQRLVESGMLRWVSADLDKFKANEETIDEAGDSSDPDDEGDDIGNTRLRISKARLMAVTLVPKPAFQECTIELVPEGEGVPVLPDGIYVEGEQPVELASIVAAANIARSIPLNPPSEWFDDPNLTKPTALQISDDGQVFGHIAAWDVDHIGMNFGTKPPRSRSNYAYFHTGVVRADDGKDVPVGQLTLAGGHAGLEMSAQQAVRHYDDTASAIADVHAGEDTFGIWVAGALRPSATAEQIRSLRASAPSGDWRVIRGRLELVAVCQVNVPGFPIARTMVASGQLRSLVAAGASALARMTEHEESLSERIARLERQNQDSLSAKAAPARARLEQLRSEKQQALAASAAASIERIRAASELSIDEYVATFADKRKGSMKDGSFPIPDVAHLKKAIKAYGRASDDKKAAVRRHIISKARKLGKSDLIPSGWREASASDLELSAQDAREAFASARAQNTQLAGRGPGTWNGSKFTPKTQPRDTSGKFRDILARLKLNLGGAREMQDVVDKATEAEGFNDKGDYQKAQKSGTELLDILDRVDTGALDSTQVTGLREGARQLGEALAYLPLPFEDQNLKLRYSDLPPTMKDLIQGMITRVEDKLGPDAAQATATLKNFIAGGQMFSQSEIQSEMATLLRLLT